MDFRLKNDDLSADNKFKRIVLTVHDRNSFTASFIEDSPEALQEAGSSGAHAVSWFRFKAPEGAGRPAIYQGDFIIPFSADFPDNDISTAEQSLLASESQVNAQGFGLDRQILKNHISEILIFTKWLQKQYGLNNHDIKLFINKQWGWVGLVIPAGLLGTNYGGPGLPSVYQSLGQRLLKGWKSTWLNNNLAMLEPSMQISDWLKRNLQAPNEGQPIHNASLSALSTVWLDLRGNQNLFDLDSFEESSWFQLDSPSGNPAHSILYGQSGLKKSDQATRLAWEIMSTINQLAKKSPDSMFWGFQGLLSHQVFDYLIKLKDHSKKWLQKYGDRFRPLNFYCCPAFTQMPAKAAAFNTTLWGALGRLKRDEANLLTRFRAGNCLELCCSCQHIKSVFDCGNDCGIDSPFSLAFHPEIDLREKIVLAESDGFGINEQDGLLYYRRRQGKGAVVKIQLCPPVYAEGLHNGARQLDDAIVLRQPSTGAIALITSRELKPRNIKQFRDKLVEYRFQLESNELKRVRLIQKYLRQPVKDRQMVFSHAGWHKSAEGGFVFLHPNEDKVHPVGVEYIQQLPNQELCLVTTCSTVSPHQNNTHPVQFENPDIRDNETKEWIIFLICLAISSTLLPFAALSGAGYFLWGKQSEKVTGYIFSLIYGRFADRYRIDWPLKQTTPEVKETLADLLAKNKTKIYKRDLYQNFNNLLNTYNNSLLFLIDAQRDQFVSLKRLGEILASDKNRKQNPIRPLSSLDLGKADKNQKRRLNFITCFTDAYRPQQNGLSGRLINIDLGDISDTFPSTFYSSGLMWAWLACLEMRQPWLNSIIGPIDTYLDTFLTDVLSKKEASSTGLAKSSFKPMKTRQFTPKEEVARRFGLAAWAGVEAKRMGLFGDKLTESEVVSACQNRFRYWLEQPQKPPRNISPQDIEDTIRSFFFQQLSELKKKTPEQETKIMPYIKKLSKGYDPKVSPWLRNKGLQGLSPGYWFEFDWDKRVATCIVTARFLRDFLMPADIKLASFKAILRRAGLLKDENSQAVRISTENRVIRGYIFDLSYIFKG